MKNQGIFRPASAFLAAVVMTSCALFPAAKPVAIIQSPPSGALIEPNAEISVQILATDNTGIVKVELWVNGALVATENSPVAGGQTNFPVVMRWTPKTAGPHLIEARAFNKGGEVNAPAAISVQVKEGIAVAPTAAVPALTVAAPPVQPNPTSAPPPPITVVAPTSEPLPPQQPTIPAAPAAPSAFNANGTGTTIAFTWIDNSLNETGFRIYQVFVVAPVVPLPGTHAATGGMAHNWIGRPCNITGTFYVRAYNDAGESAPSNTNGAVTIPCAPTNFIANGVSQVSITGMFTDNATNESGFHVYRAGSPLILRTLSLGAGTVGQSYAVGPENCGQTASYYVRAFNLAGESALSNLDVATTQDCTVKITFTKIDVHNDANPAGPGDIYCIFIANASSSRWPNAGAFSMNSGDIKAIIGESLTLSLPRTTPLVVKIYCYRSLAAPDLSLGAVEQTYSGASGWSEGDKSVESAGPNYFRIYYTITVTP